MEIVLNKDFTKFKSEKWKGLTQSQIVFGGAMIVVTVGGMLFFTLYCHVPVPISSFLISPITFILGMLGFYEPDGMAFLLYLQEGKNHNLLVYKSMIEELDVEDGKEQEKEFLIRRILDILKKNLLKLQKNILRNIQPIFIKAMDKIMEQVKRVQVKEVEHDKEI